MHYNFNLLLFVEKYVAEGMAENVSCHMHTAGGLWRLCLAGLLIRECVSVSERAPKEHGGKLVLGWMGTD